MLDLWMYASPSRMGEKNIRYEDVKAAADENGRSVAETLDIMDRTVAIDREDHAQEPRTGVCAYASGRRLTGSAQRDRPLVPRGILGRHVIDRDRSVAVVPRA